MPVLLPSGERKPTFEELPLDAEMLQCRRCTAIYQPWENQTGICHHCSNSLETTIKAGVFIYRNEERKVPYDKALLKECKKILAKK